MKYEIIDKELEGKRRYVLRIYEGNHPYVDVLRNDNALYTLWSYCTYNELGEPDKISHKKTEKRPNIYNKLSAEDLRKIFPEITDELLQEICKKVEGY